MSRALVGCTILIVAQSVAAQPAAFTLAPALGIEAEQFTIERGWKVIENGAGNYMVDIVGFNHISGERLLGIDEREAAAVAFVDVELPEGGDYRVWVRYEYPPFTECRFRVQIKQGARVALDTMMGAKDNPRYSFGEGAPRPQYDPPWGPEGLVDEVATARGLAKGPARICLIGVEQPQTPGRTARRHIDFVYLSRDTGDAWLPHYKKSNPLYPILDAYRDSVPPRWEVRFTNRGNGPAGFAVHHHYNRHPWGVGEGVVATDIPPGAVSPWIGLTKQDTTHYGLIEFTSTIKQPFDLDIRPAGGAAPARSERNQTEYGFYFPHYPRWGEPVISRLEAVENARRVLAARPPIGRAPTKPLCYGGWIPVGRDDEIGRAYAKLYAELGLRATPSAPFGPARHTNLSAAGLKRTRSESAMTYRNPPTPENIAAAEMQFPGEERRFLQWFDYGDEIGFGEWVTMMLDQRVKELPADPKPTAEVLLAQEWQRWLAADRAAVPRRDYWLGKWGAFDESKLRPDSSAEAAKENPRLYVDSLIFYEEAAMQFAADGMRAAKQRLGADVWCGANYSGHPFYFPTATMYVKWFRRNCADMGRHSEYFWQVGQAGPMINGYFAEHFRAGFRHNPRAVLRQYTMPHAPGNSDASFLRSAFSHLAHGAKMLDFFGIGMNDAWTENYVDFRFPQRYAAMRDVTHAVGLIEDVILESKVHPSPVALLVSESTERWDFAGIATDRAGHAHFGPEFRKTRLHHHLDRFGIWQALTFRGFPPDLLIEEDLTPEVLKSYRVLIVVGDCLNPEVVKPLEAWVRGGGVILATSRAGQFDAYKKDDASFFNLLGIEFRGGTESAETFARVRQELPYLQPRVTIKLADQSMPVLIANERIRPGNAEVLARFTDDDSAALTCHPLGQGKVFYTPTHPGISSLWTALQPPVVADRSPTSHRVPQRFDAGASAMWERIIQAANLKPVLLHDQSFLDARLIETPSGYIVPLANYHDPVGQAVTLKLAIQGPIRRATSAYLGEVPIVEREGRWFVTLKSIGYGDVLRLDR